MKDNNQSNSKENFLLRLKKNLKPFFSNLKDLLIKIKRKIKKNYKKYKYMDRTKARFFMMATVISLFCLFVGGTYAYFNIIEHLDSSIITIARLKYQLTSTNTNFQNNSITVGAGETLELTLDLKSLNSESTKYALNYSSTENVKVFYQDKLEQNVKGTIGSLNSIININIVIENTSDIAQTVDFQLKGGYLQNTLMCNILDKYKKKLELILNSNGGTPDIVNTTVEYRNIYGELPVPLNEGKIFTGWYTENIYGEKITPSTIVSLNTNHTLYAHWKNPEFIQLLAEAVANKTDIPTDAMLKSENPDWNKTAPSIVSYKDTDFNDNIASRTTTYDQESYYTYSDSYIFDANNASYTLNNPQICKYSECYETLKGKYIVDYVGSSSSSIASSSNRSRIYKVSSATTLESLKYIPSTNISVLDYSEDGIYSMEDDYGTSYYFRGALTNNYIKFGNFYWRIIRINGDGSVRIIYDGTSAHANGETSTDRIAFDASWATSNGWDAKYVGYMYGGTNNTNSEKRIEFGMEDYEDSLNAVYNETSSNMKAKLEEWYVINIKNKGLDDYVADQIFCNDRSFASSNTGEGYGKTNKTKYGALERVGYDADLVSPKLLCNNKNDAFTKNTTEKGNGLLSEKIGLITADEVALAGAGKIGLYNHNYYLYKGARYWTGSPNDFSNTLSYLYVVNYGGSLAGDRVNTSLHVVPVISLTSEYFKTFIGDGTMSNPFRARDVEP